MIFRRPYPKHDFKVYPKEGSKSSLFNTVMLAHFILILHIGLIAGVGLFLIFFNAFLQNFFWILIGGLGVLSGTAYLVYRKIKKHGQAVQKMVQSPLLLNKSVEVSLLGGLASVRIGQPDNQIGNISGNMNRSSFPPLLQSNGADDAFLDSLNELTRLLEKGLITQEEFQKAKRHIFK